MKNNTNNNLKKKFNWKKFGIWLLVILSIISIFGIVFSTWNFTKNINDKNSKDIGDKLQLTFNVTLDENKKQNATAEDQKNSIETQLKDVANSFYEQTKKQNINDFEITYGIPKQINPSNNQNKIPTYGEINLKLSVSDPGLEFNQKLALSKFEENEKDIKKNPQGALNQQLKYFYRFANNFNLKLIKYKTARNDNSITAFPEIEKNYFYQLNKESNASFDDKKTIGKIELDPTTTEANGKNWNLKSLQKEFVEVVNITASTPSETTRDTTNKTIWEQSNYNNEKAAEAFLNDNKFTKAPESQYLIWNNRSDLVNRLQMATFAAFLYQNRKSFPANSKEIFVASELINSFSLYEKDFGFWLIANPTHTSTLNIDILNNPNPLNDKLIELLKGYYDAQTVSIPEGLVSQSDKDTLTTYKADNKPAGQELKYLYSWNIENNKLINKSLLSIDYANFFKFFENNNAEWLKEEDKSTFYGENYFTKNFLVDKVFAPSSISLKNYVQLLNLEQPSNLYFNSTLTDLFNKGNSWGNANFFNDKVKPVTLNIIDYLSVYTQTSLNTIITLPTSLAAFLGIFLIILAIGILVSVLYRVPGFVAAITTTLSFTLSCLIYSSLGLSFSFGIYLLLAMITILAYIPIIYFLDYIRLGINKGYNLWNSFKYALRKFAKIFFGIYVSLLIFGLVFLFFGFLQIQSFGVLLATSSLLGIVFNAVIYSLVLWALIACIETKYNVLVPKKYVESLNIIKSTTFQTASQEIHAEVNKKSLAAKMANKIDFKFKASNWLVWLMICIGVIAIAGLTLLFVLGPGFSLDYSNGTLISLISKEQVSDDIINKIVANLGLTLVNKQINTSADYIETILIFNNSKVLWNDVAQAIKKANAESLLTNFSVLENSTLTSFELSNNVIKCIFISFGFFAIWSFIWLNVVNVLPVFLLQSINVFVVAGIIGITRIPFTINSLISLLVVIIFFSSMIFGLLSDLKVNFNSKKTYTKDELCEFVKKQTSLTFDKFNFFVLSYLIVNIILIIFMSPTFWLPLGISMISIFVLYFVNYYLTPTFFIWGMLMKKSFSQERHKISISKYLQNVETGSGDKTKDFDKVDEQEIYGLNKFKIKEIR